MIKNILIMQLKYIINNYNNLIDIISVINILQFMEHQNNGVVIINKNVNNNISFIITI